MQLEKVRYAARARAACAFGPLSRFPVLLFAATLTLTPSAISLAQQPAQTAGQTPGAAAATKTQKETAMNQSQATQRSSGQAADKDAIRPFHLSIPAEALADLRRRIAATRWPEQETRRRCIARRAARDDAEARALLGDGLRLAEGRGEAERPAAVHHRRSTGSTSTSSTSVRSIRTRCR